MPIATIIIPCGERHIPLLPRAIQSARAQTIPVDVLWHIDREKRGPGWVRDLLARQAQSPFVIMLDADDYLRQDFVEKTLQRWYECPPATYIYTDWHTPQKGDMRATSCYGFAGPANESQFHLPATLFPTRLYHAIGGHDHNLWMAEDTDFFLKANVMGIGSSVVREPLFYYTDDGYRSKEGFKDPRWQALAQSVFDRYRGRLSMACCGKPANKSILPKGTRQEGDILVRPLWNARMKTLGRVTRRDYGTIGRATPVWIDPRDFNEREYEKMVDVAAIAPSVEEVKAATATNPNDPVAVLEAQIRKAGVRIWGAEPIKHGFDIQQTPSELAPFLAECQARGVKRVLEIGTGESAGLARFMVEVLGWEVVSVDPAVPSVKPAGSWTHIQATSDEYEAPQDTFDMVFIDGDHSYEQAKRDWERFKNAAPIVGFHDIALDGWWAEGSAKVWAEVSRTQGGKLRKGFAERIEPMSKQGLGWYIDERA